MSKGIVRSAAADYQRWTMPDLAAEEAEDEISSEVLAEIERVRARAERDGHAAGLERGRADGLAEGRALAETELDSHRSAIRDLIEALASPVARIDEEVEESLLELALAIARQIIRRELRVDRGQILAVIKEAYGLLPVAERKVILILHPEDARLVGEALKPGDELASLTVREDPGLSRGGCSLHTQTSVVDATLESRIAKVAAQLLGGERQGERRGERVGERAGESNREQAAGDGSRRGDA